MNHAAWVRVAVAGGAVVLALIVARVVDRRLAHRSLTPGAVTRYRILRQSILGSIIFIGVLSALLVIPQVRAVAAGVLASSAVIGLVLGFAAQRTIGNFIAGLLIAFTQPVRLGDEIEVGGTRGVVEEIGLVYTWLRTNDNDRLAIPNEKLVSESIRNSTIRSSSRLAEVSVRVPLSADLASTLALLAPGVDQVLLSRLADDATIVVRRLIDGDVDLDQAESDLRLLVAERLRVAGIEPAGA